MTQLRGRWRLVQFSPMGTAPRVDFSGFFRMALFRTGKFLIICVTDSVPCRVSARIPIMAIGYKVWKMGSLWIWR